MEASAGAAPSLPHFQQSAAAASVILQKKTRSSGCCLLACTLTARRLGRGCFMPFPVSERLLSVSCSQCLQPSTAISLPNEPFIYITSGMFGLHESN